MTMEVFNRLDIVINNAGVMNDRFWELEVDVNLVSLLFIDNHFMALSERKAEVLFLAAINSFLNIVRNVIIILYKW